MFWRCMGLAHHLEIQLKLELQLLSSKVSLPLRLLSYRYLFPCERYAQAPMRMQAGFNLHAVVVDSLLISRKYPSPMRTADPKRIPEAAPTWTGIINLVQQICAYNQLTFPLNCW